MRRILVLCGVWLAGVASAGGLAFAAVGQVANGVAPHDVARLSQTAIEDELHSGSRPAPPSTAKRPAQTSTSRSTASSSTSSTSSTRPTSVSVPTTVAVTMPTLPVVTTTVSLPPAPHNTVTTSQGGTLFTRCTGPDSIAFVAAVPKSGYRRTVDVEAATGIEQTFEDSGHRSTISAECSNGVVNAHVEEESADN